MVMDFGRVPMSPGLTRNNPATVTLGASKFWDIVLQDAATNTPSTILKFEHGTSGTPIASASAATAFGGRILLTLDDTINNKQNAAGLVWFWRAVNAAVGGCAGSLSVMVQSAGNFLEGLRVNDYSTQFRSGNGTTNPGISFQVDNTIGVGLDGSNRLYLGHTSVPCLVVDSVSGIPRMGVLGKANAPSPAQTFGAATAGGAWTAAEQAMLQKAYDCLRTFGFGT